MVWLKRNHTSNLNFLYVQILLSSGSGKREWLGAAELREYIKDGEEERESTGTKNDVG